MAKSIKIEVNEAPEGYYLGDSKFFGMPTVPAEWADDFYENEIFFCQIRLKDLHPFDKDGRLPDKGYLYVFIDIGSYPYEPRVLYYDGTPDTALVDFNDEVEGGEHLTQAWLMSFSEADEDEDGIKLFGTPTDWCYGERMPKMLMQYDPLASKMGFLDSIDGYMYLFFGENEKNFDEITLHIERS